MTGEAKFDVLLVEGLAEVLLVRTKALAAGQPIEDGSFTVNERERLRRDDLSRSDAGADMFATISAGYVVCVMAIVLYAKLGALVRREMR